MMRNLIRSQLNQHPIKCSYIGNTDHHNVGNTVVKLHQGCKRKESMKGLNNVLSEIGQVLPDENVEVKVFGSGFAAVCFGKGPNTAER